MLKEYKFIDINDYRKLKFIGNGCFASVFRVQEKLTGKIYAAKILREFYGDEEKQEEELTKRMQIESSVYSRLNFPSITKFYGVCSHDFDDEPFPALILEYIPKGSLSNIVTAAQKGDPLPPKWNNTKILINIFGIASGLEHMHSNNILYRDLKTHNVLEDNNYYPKLSDFGLSKIITDQNQENTKNTGTPLYMAPEMIQGGGNYTTAADVYSFSLVVYELLTNEAPFSHIKNLNLRYLSSLVSKGKRPVFKREIPKCYKDLITKCWAQNPDDRPTFSEIVEMLKKNREFVTELNVNEEEYFAYVDYICGKKPYPAFSEKETEEEEEEDEEDKPLSIKIDSFDLNKLERLNIVGEGSFGVVYEARDKSTNKIYAAKVSKSEIYECLKKDNETVNLIREVMILSRLYHPAIMNFVGFSPINFKKTPKPVIITELLKNGTLEDLIEMERKGLACNEWDATKKLINIYGIASSMKYLHSLNILHRDLKPSNILVDEFLFPKLADFGLSKDYTSKSDDCERLQQTDLLGTPIYISPEIYGENIYSKAGDVYAFGLIVYELMTLTIPSVGNNRIQIMWNVLKGVRPSFDIDIPNCYKDLIEQCWDQDPNKRPSFEEIVNTLRNDTNFITDLVVESEYLDYVDSIDQNQINTKSQTIQVQQQKSFQDEELNIISDEKGFINLTNYQKKNKMWKNDFWKVFEVVDVKINEKFLAKMSTMQISNFSKDEINGLKEEVNILSSLDDHPSILKFIGYSLTNFKNEKKPVLVTEYSLKQTLENIIDLKRKNIKSEEWTETKMLIIIYGIAAGMSYLHSKGVLHHDLMPGCIYIDSDLLPKISDYGNFTKIQIVKSMSSQSASKMQNVPNYSAPEILNSEEPTKASDVYSFALIVYEILTREKPFKNLQNTHQIFIEVVTKCERPEFPTETEERIADCYRELIEACWAQNQYDRPSFDDILNVLKTDSRFLTENIDKQQFFDYIELVDKYADTAKYHDKIVDANDEPHICQKIVEEIENDGIKQEPNDREAQPNFNEPIFNIFDENDSTCNEKIIEGRDDGSQVESQQSDVNSVSCQIENYSFTDLFDDDGNEDFHEEKVEVNTAPPKVRDYSMMELFDENEEDE